MEVVHIGWLVLVLLSYSELSMSMQLEKGVEVLFGTSRRLDTRLSGVCQTALKVGDHLQVGSTNIMYYKDLDILLF